jgi:hypothetical protein
MKGVEFREASIFKELVGAKPQEGSYRRISASVSGKNISSLMVRFRYNPVGDLNQEGQPFFLLHEIPDNLLVRLLLVGPIIFSILRLHSFLSLHKILLPSLLALSLCLAFFTEHLAVLGSSIAIYIIGAGILEQKNGALVMGLIFITGAILGETVVPSHSTLLSCLVLVGILGWVLISWKTNHTRPELGQILVVSGFHLLVGGIYNWNFLLSVCPMNLLVGLLWLHH